MTKYQLKEIFSVIGKMSLVEGKHRFIPNSTKYLSDRLDKIPLGKEISCMFSEHVPARSEAQLAYHFVLMGYMSEHTGFTKDEMHDIAMKTVFGVTKKTYNGKVYECRQSISNSAKLPKYKAVELVNWDLSECAKLQITVPSKQELGYV